MGRIFIALLIGGTVTALVNLYTGWSKSLDAYLKAKAAGKPIKLNKTPLLWALGFFLVFSVLAFLAI